MPQGLWRTALEKIAAADPIEWQGGTAIRFADTETARYLGGIWLEEYAWHVVRDERVHEGRGTQRTGAAAEGAALAGSGCRFVSGKQPIRNDIDRR